MRAVRIYPWSSISKRCYTTISYSSFATPTLIHEKPEKYGVPALEQSVEKYLAYTKPLVPPEQWERTRKVASEFTSSPHVVKLQELLETRAKMEDNWLFDWWLDSYLAYRAPVVVHSSPAMRMKTVPFKSDQEWLMYAAGIVRGVLNFKKKLESRYFPTDLAPGGEAMCMAQFYALLCNCRIPGVPKDRLLSRRGGPHNTLRSNHLNVLYRNRVFRMEFRDPVTMEHIAESLLYRQLEHIVQSARSQPPGTPMGLLTTLPRDQWASVHRALRQNVQNSNILTDIERGLFVLCLDDSAQLPRSDHSEDSQDHRDTVSSENVLHGQVINSGNRWFDKSVQFIISRDGSIGLNFEHTAADAGSLVPIISEVYQAVEDPVPADSTRLPIFARPCELSWQLKPELAPEVDRAEDTLKRLVESVEVQYKLFRDFGSSAIKSLKFSPDAFVQIALQLAYARIHPDLLPPPTYESGTLRRFFLGRTDTIRSCSQESVEFTKAMADSSVSTENKRSLLHKALKRHQDFTKEVLSGQAFDRHLLGLHLLAGSLTDITPEAQTSMLSLFDDPTYTMANHYRLSTSQVRSPDDCAVSFGPVVPDGYGFCYNVRSDTIQATATSFRTSSETKSPAELQTHLSQALSDMRNLLESA